MMMMMMINFINVSRPHSLGKSHTNLGTQLIDIKNMQKDSHYVNVFIYRNGFYVYVMFFFSFTHVNVYVYQKNRRAGVSQQSKRLFYKGGRATFALRRPTERVRYLGVTAHTFFTVSLSCIQGSFDYPSKRLTHLPMTPCCGFPKSKSKP